MSSVEPLRRAAAIAAASSFDGKLEGYIGQVLALVDEHPEAMAFLSDSARVLWPKAAPAVRRLLAAEGLDRLVPVYSSVEAAITAGDPDGPVPPGDVAPAIATPRWPARPQDGPENGPRPAPLNEAVLRQLIDALADGIVLVGEDGRIMLANRRAAEMFGSRPGELGGQLVESLMPAGLRDAHRLDRAAYALKPAARPMADRAALVALRAWVLQERDHALRITIGSGAASSLRYAIAMTVQACFSAFAIGAVFFAFRHRKDADPQLLAALFFACSICAVPYLLSYDTLPATSLAVMLLGAGTLGTCGMQCSAWPPAGYVTIADHPSAPSAP